MNTILEKEFITPEVFRMRVEAPEIAKKRKTSAANKEFYLGGDKFPLGKYLLYDNQAFYT